MKKALTILIIFATVLVFSACSGKAEPTNASVASSSSQLDSSGNPESDTGSIPSSDTSQTVSSQKSSSSKAASSPSTSSEPQPPQQVTITIPEGFTLSQVGDRLQAHNICKKDDFVKATQTYDFSYYPLVKAIPANPNRCYRLEGYLYPDTYTFYVNMKPQDAVGKFLRNAESAIDGKYSYSGMTTDQVITLASIIEREADNPTDMKMVSSVFHNRLKQGMILQADSTRDYCNNYLVPLFGSKFNKYYNTYPDRAPGLPVGAISNPGSDALNAAAHPADTKYLYFATGTNHKYYYGTTMQERNDQMKADNVTALYAD